MKMAMARTGRRDKDGWMVGWSRWCRVILGKASRDKERRSAATKRVLAALRLPPDALSGIRIVASMTPKNATGSKQNSRFEEGPTEVLIAKDNSTQGGRDKRDDSRATRVDLWPPRLPL